MCAPGRQEERFAMQSMPRASLLVLAIFLAACNEGKSVTAPARPVATSISADKSGGSETQEHSNLAQRVEGNIYFAAPGFDWELIAEHGVTHANGKVDGQ